MSVQGRIKGMMVGGLMIGVLGMMQSAGAAAITWTNVPAGGSWETGANWNSGALPGTGDIAYLTNSTASYTVTSSASNTVAQVWLGNAGANRTTLTLNPNSDLESTTVGVNANLILYSTLNVNSAAVFRAKGEIGTDHPTITINQGGTMQYGAGGNNQGLAVNTGTINVFGTLTGSTLGYQNSFCNLSSSTMTIDGGIATLDATVVGYDGFSTINVTNNGILTIRNINGIGGLSVGQGVHLASSGALNLSSGIVTNLGQFIIAPAPVVTSFAGDDTVAISGGRFIQSGLTAVGQARNGVLNISGSGLFVTTNTVFVGGTNAPALSGSATASGKINLTGGQFVVTNGAGLASLFVGNVVTGTVILSGGTLTVDSLIVTNSGASIFTFSGGTLNTKAANINNGPVFLVGNGNSTATLGLLTGSHVFANGVTITNNGVFASGGTNALGTVTITGDVTLKTGAVLDCDFNATTNDWAMITGILTLPTSVSLSVREVGGGSDTPSTIPVMQATTISGNAGGWGPVWVNGRKYRAVSNSSQLYLERMTPGTTMAIQ